MLCAGFFVMGMLAHYAIGHRRNRTRRNPLADLMQPAALGEAVDLAKRRNAQRAASQAILRGMADHGDHTDLHNQIAAVLRAGLRRGDQVSQIDGDGFVIVLPGADERSAARIAERLRTSLARLRTQGSAGTAGVSASFGVAAGPAGGGANDARLMRQARRALHAARSRGTHHVVTASEMEEVLYLPGPVTQPTTAAA